MTLRLASSWPSGGARLNHDAHIRGRSRSRLAAPLVLAYLYRLHRTKRPVSSVLSRA